MPAAPAVLLLSGGLDSTTMLAYAVHAGFDVHAMTFRYGQRHASEIEAARRVARHYGVRDHVVVDIDLRTFGGSALTADIAVPKDRTEEAIGHGIPITYVPARNTIFLSFWTILATRTVAPSTSPPSRPWRTSPRAGASKALRPSASRPRCCT
jgi:7-cyano-7-deazaguanine synthase